MKPEVQQTLHELFSGPDIKEVINTSNRVHLANVQAIMLALFDKGVITPEEFNRYHILATQQLDQQWQAKVDAQKENAERRLKELEKELPVLGPIIANMARRDKDGETT